MCTFSFLKLAEKRKALVDEMSIKGQESVEEQKKKMEEIQEKLRVSYEHGRREYIQVCSVCDIVLCLFWTYSYMYVHVHA